MTTRVCGCYGYSPEHLCELPFEQCYDDGEADAGWDQVEQSGLQTGVSVRYSEVILSD